jgi:carbonic anhydrase
MPKASIKMELRMGLRMRLFATTALLLGFSAIGTAQNNANWNYAGHTGPLLWGRLDPAYGACSRGHAQSPVDIRGAHLNTSLAPVEFHYIAGPVTVENTGRGIIVHVDPGGYIMAGGTRYELADIEFHHPSEHGVKGKLTDMEVDLVHKSAEGKLAILAVRMSEVRGDPNATLATLWQHLPAKAGATEKITDMVNPGGLLPGDRGYWTYTGSTLTPPCSENVQWIVFEDVLSISREQLRAFTNLYRMNTRPFQDLHGRRIEANE